MNTPDTAEEQNTHTKKKKYIDVIKTKGQRLSLFSILDPHYWHSPNISFSFHSHHWTKPILSIEVSHWLVALGSPVLRLVRVCSKVICILHEQQKGHQPCWKKNNRQWPDHPSKRSHTVLCSDRHTYARPPPPQFGRTYAHRKDYGLSVHLANKSTSQWPRDKKKKCVKFVVWVSSRLVAFHLQKVHSPMSILAGVHRAHTHTHTSWGPSSLKHRDLWPCSTNETPGAGLQVLFNRREVELQARRQTLLRRSLLDLELDDILYVLVKRGMKQPNRFYCVTICQQVPVSKTFSILQNPAPPHTLSFPAYNVSGTLAEDSEPLLKTASNTMRQAGATSTKANR